jgi:hypothetical protein
MRICSLLLIVLKSKRGGIMRVAPPLDCSMELPQLKAELEAAMWDLYSGVITTKMGLDIGMDIGICVGCL